MSIEVAQPTWRNEESARRLADLEGSDLVRLAALAVAIRVSGLVPSITYGATSDSGLTTRERPIPDEQYLRVFARVNAGAGDTSTILGAALSFADNSYESVVHGSGGSHHDADELNMWKRALESRPYGKYDPEAPGSHTMKGFLLEGGAPWTLLFDLPDRSGGRARPVTVIGETAEAVRLYDPSRAAIGRRTLRYVYKQTLLGAVAASAGFSVLAVRRPE